MNLGSADLDNRLIYLNVRKVFKQGTDNLKQDHKNGQKGLTEVIKGIKKGNTKYREILIDTNKVEITKWTITITEK